MTAEFQRDLTVEGGEQLHCGLWAYQRGLSLLLLRSNLAEHFEEQVTYILFSSVIYIEAPQNWRGANFSERAPQEAMNLLARTAPHLLPRIATEPSDTRLFECTTAHVCIVASGLYRTTTYPANFGGA